MPELSAITLPNGDTYTFKDTVARQSGGSGDYVSRSGDTMTGNLAINKTGNTQSVLLRETDDHRGAMYVKGPEGCGSSLWYANNNGSSEIDFKNADGDNRVGMYVSVGDEGVVYLRDTNNDSTTIRKSDVDRWNSNSRVLLWENSNVSSAFVEQDVYLPSGTSSKYDRIFVDYATTEYHPWVYTTNYLCKGTEGTAMNNVTSTDYLYNIWRRALYSNDSDYVHFYPGQKQNVGAGSLSTVDDNKIVIPWHIWGIPNSIETGTVNPSTLINVIYPVGSIYTSVNNVDPGTFLAGTTWERIQDTFLLASGSTYAAGTTGGEAEHTLTESEMPVITGNAGTYNSTPYARGAIFSDASGAFSVKDAKAGYVGRPNEIAASGSTSYNGITMAFGGGQAHNNMPPYLAVYVWKRIS